VNCKRTHFVGTTLVLFMMLRDVRVLALGVMVKQCSLRPTRVEVDFVLALEVLSAGFLACQIFISHETGIAEALVMLLTGLCMSKVLAIPPHQAMAPVYCGYFFAWVGHFFFEHNRPATFIYPAYSLISDFRMYAGVLMGRHSLELQSLKDYFM
jgi:hypothetical protein